MRSKWIPIFDQVCDVCGMPAECWHHEPYVCEGNCALPTVPLCRKHHLQKHSDRGDWARWGSKGGKKTAANPENWKRNLAQYQRKDASKHATAQRH